MEDSASKSDSCPETFPISSKLPKRDAGCCPAAEGNDLEDLVRIRNQEASNAKGWPKILEHIISMIHWK